MNSEVKGSFFVSVRSHFEATDPEALVAVIKAMPAEHRAALESPIASAWYPEAALSAMFHAVHATFAKNNHAEFERWTAAVTEVGLGKFFKVILRLSSPRFVLRQAPMIWKQLRRGGAVEVVDTDGLVELRYSGFPPFSDVIYEVGTVASIRALVRLCAGRDVPVVVASRPTDGLVLRVDLREARST